MKISKNLISLIFVLFLTVFIKLLVEHEAEPKLGWDILSLDYSMKIGCIVCAVSFIIPFLVHNKQVIKALLSVLFLSAVNWFLFTEGKELAAYNGGESKLVWISGLILQDDIFAILLAVVFAWLILVAAYFGLAKIVWGAFSKPIFIFACIVLLLLIVLSGNYLGIKQGWSPGLMCLSLGLASVFLNRKVETAKIGNDLNHASH